MHLQEKDYINFQNETMSTEEMIAFLEHLDHCDFCLEQLMNEEQTAPVPAPPYFRTQVLEKASSIEVQAARTVSQTSHRMNLFYDRLRTAAGIIAALIFLFGISFQVSFSPEHQVPADYASEQTVFPQEESIRYFYDFSQNISTGLTNGSRKITDYLNNLSNKIMNGGK